MSVSAQEASSMPVSVPSNPSMSGLLMHKNRLQQCAQKLNIPLPMYQTVNVGSPHAPKFRSSVIVYGETYQSSQTFAHRKAAEQDVAKLALEGLSTRLTDEVALVIREDTTFCKSILNEFAVKMNVEKPSYKTTPTEGLLPLFSSSLVFDGVVYIGDAGRNKKEAEQLGARAAIQSILGKNDNSGSTRNLLSKIIKSKYKLYAALHIAKDSCNSHDLNICSGGNLPNNSDSVMIKGETVAAALETNNSIDTDVETSPVGQLADVPSIQAPAHEIKKPKEEESTVGQIIGSSSGSPAGSGIRLCEPVFDQAHPINHDQVKTEVPLEVTVALGNESLDTSDTGSVGRKRSAKNGQEVQSKKKRNDGQ